MNNIGFFDLGSLIFFIIILFILLRGWKNRFSYFPKSMLLLLVTLSIFHSFSNFLEWFEISDFLDPYEDYVQILEPILWYFFFAAFIQETMENNRRASEKRYRHLFETSPYFIGLLDTGGILIDCNISVNKFLSIYTKEDLIGKSFTEIFTLNKKNEYLIPMFEIVFNNILKGINPEPIDFKLFRSSGDYQWLHIEGSLIEFENQILIQFIIQDISERKKAELIIQEEIEKLRELDHLKNEFVVRTSHELKTPLVSICGSTEFLLNYNNEDLSSNTIRHLEVINSGGKRLKQLVEDLLDILRLESNKFDLNVKYKNLGNIIKNCIIDLGYLSEEREITISTSFQHDIYLNVDENKIEQVFINLLSNALKNTLRKGRISISLEKNVDYINVKINDTGVGFTEEEKTKIFKKFGKIERYGKGMDIISEGTGLGLYLSRKIVELHGGKIWVESEGRNKGSIFIVNLPMDGN